MSAGVHCVSWGNLVSIVAVLVRVSVPLCEDDGPVVDVVVLVVVMVPTPPAPATRGSVVVDVTVNVPEAGRFESYSVVVTSAVSTTVVSSGRGAPAAPCSVCVIVRMTV